MKNIIFLLTCISLFSCGESKKMVSSKIEIAFLEPLSDKPSDALPQIIKEILEPITIDSSITAFIPEIAIRRLDIDSNNTFNINVPKSSLGDFRTQVGTYTFDNLKEEYDEEIPKLLAGKELSDKSKSKIDIEEILSNNSKLLILLKDSANKSNSEYEFTSVTKLREYLQKQLFTGKVNNFKIIYVSTTPTPPSNITAQITQVEKLLGSGEYDKAQFICQQIVQSGIALNILKPFSERLEKSADGLFDALQKAGGSNCDLIGGPMGYYVCANELASETEKIGVKTKYDKCLSYAKVKCGLITLPSLSTTTTN